MYVWVRTFKPTTQQPTTQTKSTTGIEADPNDPLLIKVGAGVDWGALAKFSEDPKRGALCVCVCVYMCICVCVI
jgi:hypothetical protein